MDHTHCGVPSDRSLGLLGGWRDLVPDCLDSWHGCVVWHFLTSEIQMAKIILADREECIVYVSDEVTYVPHYRTPSMYVAPGYHEIHRPRLYTANELKLAGAKEAKLFLWPRPKFASEAKI